MKIKVCGLTQAAQVQAFNEMGVAFGGFIFYPKSPRYVFKFMSAENIKNIKGNIGKVGVFVNAPADEIFKTADDCNLQYVQLHGDESPKECEKISDRISVIKTFRLGEGENILWKIKDYREAADMFLFDTESAIYGGAGKKFNWELLKESDIGKPFFLSGGIQPEDAETLKIFMKEPAAKDLFAIDINSKFETSPGVKNINAVKIFIHQLKL